MTVVALALGLALAGCGATDRADSPPVTNPLDEPRASASAPALAAAGLFPGVPGPAGPGSTSLAEGAAARASEHLAEQLGLPPSDFRVLAVQPASWPDGCLGVAAEYRRCAPVGAEGWKVVLVDARGGAHTLHVAGDGVEWAGEAQLQGRVLAVDAATRTATFERDDGSTVALRLALPRSARATAPLPAPGARYVAAYDASPLDDGLPVVAWLFEAAP